MRLFTLAWMPVALICAAAGAGCQASDSSGSNGPSDSPDAQLDSSDACNDACSPPFDAGKWPAVPIPDGGYPHCTSEPTPEGGACCENVYCYLPDASSCPTNVQSIWHEAARTPFNFCYCGGSGPYDPASAAQFTDSGGPCCYVINWATCM